MDNMNISSTGELVPNETLEELDARYASALTPFAVLMGFFCVFGVFGNILVIAVFCVSKEYKNTNFRTFVLFLAAIDLLSCVALMPAEIVKSRRYYSFTSDLPCKVKCFFNIFAMTAAALSLFVICIDRYRKVCQPLKKQIWPELAMKIMIGVILLSILLAIPAPIMCGVSTVTLENINQVNITAYTCAAEERFHNSIFRYIYKFGLSIILVIIAIAFIVMYTMIMRTVIRHWCKRESTSSIRFEPTRSTEYSGDKVEVEHLPNQDDVFISSDPPVPGMGKENVKYSSQRKSSKRPSTSSASSSSFMGRFSVKRSSSDASFRSRVIRRRSSTTGPGKLPYKTLIWFVLTLVFLFTFLLNAGLSFLSTKEHTFSPTMLAVYLLCVRLYFLNNIINPVIYGLLDKRFKKSCRSIFHMMKSKLCRQGQ